MNFDYVTFIAYLVGIYVTGFAGGYLIETFKKAASSVSSE